MGIELLAVVVFGLITAYIAIKKNRHPLIWFIIGGITTIVGLAIIILIKSKEATLEESSGKEKSIDQFSSFTRKLVIVVGITGLFVLIGTLFVIGYIEYQSKYADQEHLQAIVIKEALMHRTEGKDASIRDVTVIAQMYHSGSRSVGAYFVQIYEERLFKTQVTFGVFGFVLSLLLLVRRRATAIAKESYKKFSNSAIYDFLLKWKKQIIIAFAIFLVSGYVFGTIGYYYKQFSINNDPQIYYYNVFEKRNGEPLTSEMEYNVSAFLAGQDYVVKGVTMKEAETTKGKFKIFGYIVGLFLVIYINKPLWNRIVNKVASTRQIHTAEKI